MVAEIHKILNDDGPKDDTAATSEDELDPEPLVVHEIKDNDDKQEETVTNSEDKKNDENKEVPKQTENNNTEKNTEISEIEDIRPGKTFRIYIKKIRGYIC